MTNNTGPMITRRCCVCAREDRNGEWIASADVPEAGRVSHTYCPECLASASPRRKTTGRALLVKPHGGPALGAAG